MNFDKSLVTVSFVPGKSEILFGSTNFPETTHESSDNPAKTEKTNLLKNRSYVDHIF